MHVHELAPSAVWSAFAALNAVPRASKREEAVQFHIQEALRALGLEPRRDAVGNIAASKPATPGMENRPTVILQAHLDMMHQKNADTVFDFATEGIRMRVDGDWVRAEGTTLGADNGLGVAAILAVLGSTGLPHPPLEALFTCDEETGMTGALGLQPGFVTGSILLNLDTEDDDEFSIGCAGGVDVSSTGEYEEVRPTGAHGLRIAVRGATGGHSGMDIHLGRANANKVLNRLIAAAWEDCGLEIGGWDGGGLRNAIPRESAVHVAVEDAAAVRAAVERAFAPVREEYRTTDPGLTVEVLEAAVPEGVMPREVQEALILAVAACPNGIHRMSPDVPGLVQTSNNLARIQAGVGRVALHSLCRSSVDSEKDDHARGIAAAFALAGLATECTGSYPGWTPNPASPTVALMRRLYVEKFQHEPRIQACHAGLECGILGAALPGCDMVSFGPTIRGAHSPDECASVSSVAKFYAFFLDVLAHIPDA